MKTSKIVLLAICSVLLFASCKKTPDGPTGVDLRLTVTNTYDYDNIQVRVSSIEYDTAAAGSSHWRSMPLTDSGSYINMHTLFHGNSKQLSNVLRGPAQIKQLRIKFHPQATVAKGGNVFPLIISNELQQSGLVIPANFTITKGKVQNIWIAWSTSNSIQHNASNNTYVFTPDFRSFDPTITGGVEGFLKPDPAKPFITVYTDTTNSTSNKFVASTIPYTGGYFKLIGVPAGRYNVKFQSANGTYSNKEIKNIEVIKSQINNIGTHTLQ